MAKKNNQDTSIHPKPFLKWAGGKRQLLKQIHCYLPNHIKDSKVIEKYFEPFVGGGALFFFLVSNGYDIKESYLSDINKELILTYKVIQKYPEELIVLLKKYSEDYIPKSEEDRKKYFYNIREEFNEEMIGFNYEKYPKKRIRRASQMIFLNKTCFNGLYRVNRKGEFNVPAGRSKNPLICDEKNILEVSEALENTTIETADYSDCEDLITKDSLVYLDPPYRPLNNTSSFNGYSKELFDDNCQIELGEFYKIISEKEAKAILSNSDPKNTNPNDDFFEKIYKDYNIHEVSAKRFINSKGDGRGPIKEILVTNYKTNDCKEL